MGLLSKRAIGIDIGHSSVKVVGLELGHKPKFIGCKEITMDPQYLQKEGFDHPELIGQALQEAIRTAAPRPIPASPVFSVISETLIFRKIIEIPALADPSSLGQVVQMEVAQYLPKGLEEMEVDYQFLGVGSEGTTQQIMVVAVPKKIIADYLAVFAAAKLPVRAIEAKPSAVARAIVGPKETQPLVLIDIGSELSTLSVYDRGVVRVTSTLNMGGNVIRDPQTMKVDEAKQEERIKRLVAGLSEEIEHVVKFYSNRMVNTQGDVKEVRVTGGGSMITGMIEAVEKATDLKVVAGSPVIAVPAFCDRRFVGALGAALYQQQEG